MNDDAGQCDDAADAEKFSSDFLTWTKNAAEQGDSMAQFNLAVLLDVGDTLARDRLKSIEGSGMYAMCEGIPQDKTQAAHYYRMAAEQGHASAAFALAGLHEAGDGVEHSTVLAERWYQRALELGHTGARERLARNSIAATSDDCALNGEPNVCRGDAGEQRH